MIKVGFQLFYHVFGWQGVAMLTLIAAAHLAVVVAAFVN